MKLLRLCCVVLALFVAASPELFSAQKKSAKRPAATGKKKAASGKTKSVKASASRAKASSRRKATTKGNSGPATQRTPEPERIREIQQALTDRGYPVDVSGHWDASSIDALKRFQSDQNIKSLSGASGSGKIDSLTLIALGLGPKHESTPPTSPEPNREGQTQ